MKEIVSQTIEQVLFEKMGVSAKGSFATGADKVEIQLNSLCQTTNCESRYRFHSRRPTRFVTEPMIK